MKQILFLFLFPCFALAQYQGNANQKITLGEQTTADGLVFRGVASIDTVTATSKITRANKQDTSAYILLDTVTNLLWHYKIGSNRWIQAGGSTLDTATMLLPYYRAGRNTIIQAADVPTLNQNTTGSAATLTTGRTIQTNLASTSTATFNGSANITPGVTGTLPVANGGTNTGTLTANKVMVGNGTSGVLTPTNLHWDNTNSRLGISMTSPTYKFDVNNVPGPGAAIRLYGNDQSNVRLRIENVGGNTWELTGGLTGANNSDFTIYDVTNTVTALRIVPSTSNAFFSGSVTATTGKFTSVAAGTFANNLNITSDGTLTTAPSDEKYKYNILPINYGLKTILQLKPVNFQWVEGEEQDLGFIAQDVADIIPEAVNTNWNSDLLMRYESIIPILTKAIQEQQALIKALEQRILILENK